MSSRDCRAPVQNNFFKRALTQRVGPSLPDTTAFAVSQLHQTRRKLPLQPFNVVVSVDEVSCSSEAGSEVFSRLPSPPMLLSTHPE